MNWLFAPQLIDHQKKAIVTEQFGPNAKAYMAYDRLCRLYWQRGALYREDHELAAVCGLSIPSFRRVRNLIGSLFRVDDTGLWRDFALERERTAAIVAADLDPADFAPPPSPAPGSTGDGGARSPRSIAGQRNAEERWRRERAAKEAELAAREAAVADREREVAARAAAAADAIGIPLACETMPNPMPTGMPTDAKPHAVGIGLARSHLARPPEEEEEEDPDKSSSSSSTRTPRASDANAEPDANRHGGSHAKPPVGTMPTDDAKPAKAAAASGRPTRPALSNRALLDALLAAIGGKVEKACRDPHTVGPIRKLMEEGCDLDLHILPELRLLASSSTPLQTWRAPWLHEQIRERRDAPADEGGAGRPTTATARRFFVAVGTEAWLRWQAYGRDSGKQPQGYPPHDTEGGKRGWRFPTPEPPPLDRPAVAAE